MTDDHGPRILSLLSSATEVVHALGLGDRLVGISHECDYPPEALRLPRASRSRFDPSGLTSGEIDAAVRRSMEEYGSVYEVDVELLRRLSPDVVLTQGICEVCAVPTGSVTAAIESLDRKPRVVSLDVHTLGEILESVETVAEAAGAPARGAALRGRLQARLDRVAETVAAHPRPHTLLLEWLDPPFYPGHWVPEMVRLAGGELLFGREGERSAELTWEEIEGTRPDALLVEPCGYDLARTREDADRTRERLYHVAGPAINAGNAWLLHSAYFSRSGPREEDGVEVLGCVLHPELFPETPVDGRAAAWR
jgi:iron complex transport system substrate-binding protein